MSDNKLQLYVRSGAAQTGIEQTLKDRADDFTTSLLTVINGNPVLQECEPQSVVRTALKAASMRLAIDPNLGLAYIIPYNNSIKEYQTYKDSKGVIRKKEVWVKRYEPQLQIGWKGFVQLALRTGLYKTINVTDVREGEYQGEDMLTGVIQFLWEKDRAKRAKLPIEGYVAYFRLHDGFEKILHMTTQELEEHARKYSKSYANGNGKWKDDKPAMSRKTVVKLLLSKWGPQSTEMQKAFRADQAAMAEDDAYNYLDNDKAADQPKEDDQQHPPDDVPEGEVVEPTAEPVNPDQSELPPKEKSDAKIGGMRRSKLFATLKDRGYTGDTAKQVIYNMVGVTSVNDILVDDFSDVLDMLTLATDEQLKKASEAVS